MGNRIVIASSLHSNSMIADQILTFDKHSQFSDHIETEMLKWSFTTRPISGPKGLIAHEDIMGNKIHTTFAFNFFSEAKKINPLNDLNKALVNYIYHLPAAWPIYVGVEGFAWKKLLDQSLTHDEFFFDFTRERPAIMKAKWSFGEINLEDIDLEDENQI